MSWYRTQAASRVQAVAFFLILITGLVAGSAAARSLHLALSRAEPAKDSTVTKVPGMLKLWFTEPVKIGVTAVRLTSPDSTSVELAPLKMGDGKSAPVIAAIKGKMAGGKYKVAWRTAGNDGHAVSGDYSFTVKLPADIREGGR